MIARTRFVTLACVLLALCACASNPFKAATNLDQRAFASYGTFVVFEEQAAVVVQDPSIPLNVKQALKAADARAKPTADALLASVKEYEAVSIALTQCPNQPDPSQCKATTAQKLVTATANLNQWVTDATTQINALVSAVKGAK
jgi:hypothetical protein